MKSIKEKAKAYDEAIKFAKIYHNSGDEDMKTMCETMFPELKESIENEDERIRKWCISHFKECINVIKDNDEYKEYLSNKVIAWLEKQGEHANFRNKIQIGDKVTRNEDGVLVNLSQLNRVAKKQSEQKPIVNDNAKEMFIKALERVEEQNNKGYKLTDCDKNSWWEDFKNYTSCTIEQKPVFEMKTPEKSLGIDSDTYNKIVDECVYGEQNPTWSEEEEKKQNYLIALLQNSTMNNPAFRSVNEGLEEWLKSLKERVQPQPKQEWSEGDEKHIHSIISTIECDREKYKQSKVITDSYTSDLEWFKSLINRCKLNDDFPHWKKSILPDGNVTGFNSDFFSYKGYYINYKELFDKLPKDD